MGSRAEFFDVPQQMKQNSEKAIKMILLEIKDL